MTLRGGDDRPRSPWQTPPPRRDGRRLLILLGALLLFVLALLSAFPPSTWRQGDGMRVLYFVLLAAVVILGVARQRERLAALAGQFAAWMLVLAVLVAGYGFRGDLAALWQRMSAELMPSHGQALDPATITYHRANDGHFWIDAVADGQNLRFLVDTGASGVVLTRADATRLGFALDRLAFTQIFDTANGRTRGAAIELDELRLGPIAFAHVPAWVNEGELSDSLLGMGMLNRLGSVEIRSDTLTIRR